MAIKSHQRPDVDRRALVRANPFEDGILRLRAAVLGGLSRVQLEIVSHAKRRS